MEFCKFKSPQTIRDFLKQESTLVGTEITITGRITRISKQSQFTFGELVDGSCHQGMQFIYTVIPDRSLIPSGIKDLIDRVNVGSSVTLTGTVVLAPEKATQLVALSITDAKVISVVRDAVSYRYGADSMKRRKPDGWITYLTVFDD
jgi:aspartyl/asparaginyl-tRNA synthetase